MPFFTTGMIGYIEGSVISKDEKSLVIITGGVGYRVFTSNESIAKNPKSLSLFTHLAVRENALDLYGFESKEELSFFELLLTIPGIGPKSALSILNMAHVDTLRSAIGSGDVSYLTKVSGIGRKTAEKIILELKDKIGEIAKEENISMKETSDAILALVSLGYSERDVRETLKQIGKNELSTEELIKEALKNLGK